MLCRESSGNTTELGSKNNKAAATVAKRVPSLNLTPIPPDPVIVHPGLATTMLKLLPLLQYNGHAELSAALQWHTAEVIKSLLRYSMQLLDCTIFIDSTVLSDTTYNVARFYIRS